MKFTGEDGKVIEREVFAAQLGHRVANLDDSIHFARASLNFGLARNYPVYLHQEHHPEGL
jgi:isocitrate dehydrogenase